MSNVTHRARIRQAGWGEARVYGAPTPSATGMHRCLSFVAAVRGREGSAAPSHHPRASRAAERETRAETPWECARVSTAIGRVTRGTCFKSITLSALGFMCCGTLSPGKNLLISHY